MDMQIIGAGFGRTGTLSLKTALETLGFGPCYHMQEFFRHPHHAEVWDAATDGRHVDWDAALRGYRATVDWPGAAFYQELMEQYPDAKVILSVRDPERWYDSAHSTIYAISRVIARSPLFALAGLVALPQKRVTRTIERMLWQGVFGGAFDNRERAIAIFNEHNAAVQRYVPSDRLLVYEVKEGWEPLCAFLGVAVPQGTPFPHLNETASFRRVIRALVALTYALPIGGATMLVAALVAVRRRKR